MNDKLQDNFRVAVKTHLLRKRQTVTAFAASIGELRSTVSVAIHQDRFPKVRAKIARKLRLAA